MHNLVAQCIDSIEQNAEYGGVIAVAQCLLRRTPTAGEAFFPLLLTDLAVLVIPETLEYEGVIQQGANATGELGPDQIFDQSCSVERTQLVQERFKCGLLGKSVLLVDIGGVGRVKGNPEKDKASVDIVRLLGPIEPAQRSMDTQGEIGVMTFSFLNQHEAFLDVLRTGNDHASAQRNSVVLCL